MTIDRAALLAVLPALRRYARALAGAQAIGDAWLGAWLAARPSDLETADEDPRTALFRSFNRHLGSDAGTAAMLADLAELSLVERQLLLLTAIERLPLAAAATAVGLAEGNAATALARARARLKDGARADVLIIEDEPVIALDVADLVEACGHRVAGVAASHAEAVRIARESNPSLVLADIDLGAGGSGADAVREILAAHAVPVVFVTAFPERLLTGERVEPAFVITKPFDPVTLAVATFQALSTFRRAR